MKDFLVLDLGLRSYAEALSFQRALAAARIAKRVPLDVLVLVEHPAVITLGRSTKAGNLLASEALLAARGVELFEVERGGELSLSHDVSRSAGPMSSSDVRTARRPKTCPKDRTTASRR